MLDGDERARFDSYRREVDRKRFLVGATMVRAFFGLELGLPPARVPLDRSCVDCGRPHGKVRLAPPDRIQVSVSHSGDWVALAACREGTIGVDVEAIDPAIDTLGLSRIALAGTERRQLLATPPADRAAAFTRYWVRKEAVSKAVGDGLRVPFTDLEVTHPDAAPRVLAWRSRPQVVDQVWLYDLDPDDAHRASIAVIGARPQRIAHHDGDSLLRTNA